METTGIYREVNGKTHEVQIPLEEAIELYKDDPLAVYPKHFFQKMKKLRGWQNEIGESIHNKWGIKSAVDFGCASGYYLEGMHKMGASIKGYEFAYENIKGLIPEEISDFISYGDAQEDLIEGTFDLSFSIEVAEHILPENSMQFVKNLTASSNRYIIFSAATPGQKGTGHINLRSFKEWEDMMSECGFTLSKEGTKDIRNIFKNVKNSSRYSRFLSKRVMLFERVKK